MLAGNMLEVIDMYDYEEFCPISKTASTMHFLEVFLTLDRSARFPKTNESAPSKIDLPAPV